MAFDFTSLKTENHNYYLHAGKDGEIGDGKFRGTEVLRNCRTMSSEDGNTSADAIYGNRRRSPTAGREPEKWISIR